MVRIFNTVRTLCAAILASSILLAGCGSKSADVNPSALLVSIEQKTDTALADWDWSSFISNFGSLLTNVRYTLDMQKVTYRSTGADGNVHSMTGLLILPRAILGGKPSVPILMYQHGTEVYRPFSPSRYLTHQDRPRDYPEVMVAAAIASTGYAVAMVDYEGMGDNTDPQPHVVGATLALQVIDLLSESRDIIGGSNSPCTWNNQLFLMGYSEGGYVTMAVTRELQLNPVPGFIVTASAPLSGPHDLSGVQRRVILSNSTFKAPYFVPMILTSYNYAYGLQTNLFTPGFAMLPEFQNLSLMFDGNSQSVTISEAMGMTFDPVHLIIAKSILAQPFLDQLTVDTSPLVGFLKQNDSYRLPGQLDSAWVQTVPIRMIHHRRDDLVPYGNSQVALDAFIAAGSTSVQLVEETVTINISSVPVKTVHFAAAFPELSRGWKWLDRFKQ